METSATTTEITAALLCFHQKALVIGKNSQNPAFKSGPNGSASKYASLAHILEGIAAPLGECGLGFVQFPDGDGLTTRLLHKSGEWMQASMTMRPVQNTPQALGSAITYSKRQSLVAILGLRIDGDDDGNAASAAPAVETKPPVTEAQKREVITLIAHPCFTHEARANVLTALNGWTQARADKALAQIKERIAESEAA
ncbi:ERF family protein [Hymenobacter ruber]